MLDLPTVIHSVGLTFGARPAEPLSPSRWGRFRASAGHSESNYGVFVIRLSPTLQGLFVANPMGLSTYPFQSWRMLGDDGGRKEPSLSVSLISILVASNADIDAQWARHTKYKINSLPSADHQRAGRDYHVELATASCDL